MKRMAFVGAAVVALGLIGLGACGSSHAGAAAPASQAGASAGEGLEVCQPGATQVCVGPGACNGGQQCAPDGSTWGDCDCGSEPGGGGGETGGGASAGSASGGGANGGSGVGGSVASGGVAGSNVACGAAGGSSCQPNLRAFLGTTISDFSGDEPLKVQGTPDGGSWVAESDGTGTIALTIEPSPYANANGELAMHFVGSSHTGWGGDAAVFFVDASTAVSAAANYAVKVQAAGTITGGAFYAKLQNPDSLLLGCGCDPSPAATDATACYGGFIQAAFLSPTLNDHQLPFSMFEPSPFGYHARATVDINKLMNLAFVVQNLGASVSWDLWITRVSFS